MTLILMAYLGGGIVTLFCLCASAALTPPPPEMDERDHSEQFNAEENN